MSGRRTVVVGGGIFGITAAVTLAREGDTVTLFERSGELLSGASRANQRRLHRGYHYPRGSETATAAHRAYDSFMTLYGDAVSGQAQHYMAIARHKSLVNAAQYTKFCDSVGLKYHEQYPAFLRKEAVESCFRVDESLIDHQALVKVCTRLLDGASVQVCLRTSADARRLAAFDHVVIATYSSVNELAPAFPGLRREYQFEVVEKPIAHLPRVYRNTSIVVMDGPFMCLDPEVGTRAFLLGNVVHAIHASTVGFYPLIPQQISRYVNQGPIARPKHSRFKKFLAAGAEFFTGFERAEHLGSLFTVRAVLPNMEETDDRPSLVRQLDERTSILFGGKIVTCVTAAAELASAVSVSR